MQSTRQFLLRFAPMIYGPTVLFALGEGAIIPMIPVIAAKLGADLATAGVVGSMLVLGQLIGNLPAGWLVARWGERITMIIAAFVALIGVGGMSFAPTLLLFAMAVFVVGLSAAAFGLARHSFMTTRVPYSFRARSLALLGGSFRFGLFVGPFLAALALGITGRELSAVWLFAGFLVLTLLLVSFGPDPERRYEENTVQRPSASGSTREAGQADTGEPITSGITISEPDRPGVFRTMARHRAVLARLGFSAAALAAVRAARQVVLPLWGFSLGLDSQTIALIIGISGAIDFALFYASGQIMDRFGRIWAVMPSMLLMGLGFVALAFTHDLENAALWFGALACIIAVGNGFSSGILMTLGADLAPQADPAAFLGSWRTLIDGGGAMAPLIFSGLTAVTAIGVATGTMGLIALIGAFGFLRWIPRYIEEPKREKRAKLQKRK